MTFIKDELKQMWALLSKYFVPTAIISFSTLLMLVSREKVMMQPPIHIDGIRNLSINRFFLWGVAPLIFGMLVTRLSPKKMGLGLGNYRYWIPVSLIFLALVLPFVYGVSSMGDFQKFYRARNFLFGKYFIETLLMLTGWEFFFRGFMTLGLKDTLKEGSILFQMVPFTLLHMGKPLVECIACIPAGLFWGYVCYKSESFWPALIMHMAVNVTLKCGSVGYF